MHRTKMFELPCKVQVQFCKRKEYALHTLHGVDVHASFLSSISPEKFYLSFPCAFFRAHPAITGRFFAQCPPLVSHVEFLELGDNCFEQKKWWEAVTSGPGFFRQFTAVQT